MANIKLYGNTWDSSNIYDEVEGKTQAEVNSGLKTAIGEKTAGLVYTATFTPTVGSEYSKLFTLPSAFPVGIYSVNMGEYVGSMWVSARKGTKVLNRYTMWNAGQTRYMYIGEEMDKIGLYAWRPSLTGSFTMTIKSVSLTEATDRLTYDEENNILNPFIIDANSGDGTADSPYVSSDGSGGIYNVINEINQGKGSGALRIPTGCYTVSAPININHNCLRLCGDVWNYPAHPNGVFESNDGVKLKNVNGNAILQHSGGNGQCVEQIGLVGPVSNGYTVGLFDRANPHLNVGVDFTASYSDQFIYDRVSFTGLAAAVCAAHTSTGHELDAFTLRGLNTDGCNIGIFFDKVGTIYSKIIDCIIADTPAYGLFLSKTSVQGMLISGNMFVRNCGKMTTEQKTAFASDALAAVYIGNGSSVVFSNNHIHAAGDFHNYSDSSNPTWDYDDVDSLYINGVGNSIISNDISGTRLYGIVCAGERNHIANNKVHGYKGIHALCNNSLISDNIITIPTGGTSDALTIDGDYNKVCSNLVNNTITVNGDYNVITRTGSESVVVSEGATGNVLIGFDSNRITDNGTNTVIK